MEKSGSLVQCTSLFISVPILWPFTAKAYFFILVKVNKHLEHIVWTVYVKRRNVQRSMQQVETINQYLRKDNLK